MKLKGEHVAYALALASNVWVRLLDELPDRIRVPLLLACAGLSAALAGAYYYPIVRTWSLARALDVWHAVLWVAFVTWLFAWFTLVRLKIVRPLTTGQSIALLLVLLFGSLALQRRTRTA